MSTPTPPEAFDVISSGVEDGVHWFTAYAPMWGAVNGYAHLPEGHPWRGLDYAEIPHADEDEGVEGVSVNGGLTYASGEWVGFDTLHFGDYWPEAPGSFRPGDTQWTPGLVADEARSLARQIARRAGGQS